MSSGYNDVVTSLRVKLFGLQRKIILYREVLVLDTISTPFHYIKTSRSDNENINSSMAAIYIQKLAYPQLD